MATHGAFGRLGENEQGERSGHFGRGPAPRLSVGLLSLLIPLGCAHTPPSPLTEETKEQLGTIGIVSARFAPEVEYRLPGQGGAGGVVAGVAKGVGLGTLGAAGCFLTMGRVPEVCVVALGTPYFAVRYAVDQGSQGVSADEIAVGEMAIRTVFAARNAQEAVRDHVLPLAAARTGQPVTPLPDLGPATPDATGCYPHLTSHGIDTVLEVTVQRMALEPFGRRFNASGNLWRISEYELNPVLYLAATTRTRVIKTADDTVLFVATIQHSGRGAAFTEWATNDAQLLRDELDQLLPRLAAEIVAQVFGEAVPTASEPAPATEPDQGKESESQQEPSPSDEEGPAQ
jgi:hypothetical protein